MNNNHLFLFTIGPVQGFIAQARKTQDLYAGSEILSKLIRAGITAFEEAFPDGQVVFPTYDREDQSPSLPNRFIGKLHGGGDLRAKALSIQERVEAAWLEIASQSLGKARQPSSAGFEEQAANLLDIHWVFKEQLGDFKSAYQDLERLGGAVKNVRPFSQYQYEGIGELGRKCSIDGVNNVLFFRPNSGGGPKFPKGQKPAEVNGFALNPGEGLSAVSLVKRFHFAEDQFPSTAEIALMQDEAKLNEPQKEALACFKSIFSKSDSKMIRACAKLQQKGVLDEDLQIHYTPNWHDQFDYQLLYPENLNAKNIPNAKQRELLLTLYREGGLKALKTKYYGLVLFDGDKMGEWLSGENSMNANGLEGFHSDLSQALHEFGKEARAYLCRGGKNGQAVYAGGDDFLGFVNLECLFDVMQHLRKRFDKIVNEAITAYKEPDKYLTFSAGIVIAHYKTPFSEVLKKARATEKIAKSEGERDAFAITVIKHSGEVQETVFKWGNGEPADCSNWKRLAEIVSELNREDGHFSNTFIQNLTTEFAQLTGVGLYDIDLKDRRGQVLVGALRYEIMRLIGKSLDKPESKEKDQARIKTLYEAVNGLWAAAPQVDKTRHFIHALHIADFLTRKIKQD